MSLITSEEKSFLLRLARRSLETAVWGRKMEEPDPVPASLREPRGAFVSLHKKGRLHGCVGYVLPVRSLYRTVMEVAVAAALHDTRFKRVRREELPDIEVEISVLSPCHQVRPEEIQVGVHGLMVSLDRARGVLLPQVAVQANWGPLQFLEETCQKAGLPRDAWQRGAKVEAFTAEVFSEKSWPAEGLRAAAAATPSPPHPRGKYPPGSR